MSLLLALAGAEPPPDPPVDPPYSGGGGGGGGFVARDLRPSMEAWGRMVQIAIVAVAAAGGFDG